MDEDTDDSPPARPLPMQVFKLDELTPEIARGLGLDLEDVRAFANEVAERTRANRRRRAH